MQSRHLQRRLQDRQRTHRGTPSSGCQHYTRTWKQYGRSLSVFNVLSWLDVNILWRGGRLREAHICHLLPHFESSLKTLSEAFSGHGGHCTISILALSSHARVILSYRRSKNHCFPTNVDLYSTDLTVAYLTLSVSIWFLAIWLGDGPLKIEYKENLESYFTFVRNQVSRLLSQWWGGRTGEAPLPVFGQTKLWQPIAILPTQIYPKTWRAPKKAADRS